MEASKDVPWRRWRHPTFTNEWALDDVGRHLRLKPALPSRDHSFLKLPGSCRQLFVPNRC